VNNKYAQIPQQVNVSAKPRGKLTIECDEAWSFVGHKGNKQWIWLALDKKTREIVGVYIGNRSEDGARGLWNSLPPVYRQCAVCYTDFWAAYAQVIPSKRHQAVGNIVARLTILNALIIQCVKEFLVWSEKLCPFLKS
jgi:IS1 family transposase